MMYHISDQLSLAYKIISQGIKKQAVPLSTGIIEQPMFYTHVSSDLSPTMGEWISLPPFEIDLSKILHIEGPPRTIKFNDKINGKKISKIIVHMKKGPNGENIIKYDKSNNETNSL